ncbi:hypothetical protein T11_14855 [Trichinella zimbabwensis]|uniref:Uncharacterized protein n=1 Tax=Trichinella zimbabwensis TaxID=268475 RepID=A0A0V1GH40_9BILA|nr:hypothetical protein T11_14855 [Trichinella zimbabwensis]
MAFYTDHHPICAFISSTISSSSVHRATDIQDEQT